MDESLIRGLVVGAFLGLVGFVANLVWKLIRSPSEGARRFRVVGVIALVLLVGSVMVAAMGPLGAIGSAIVMGAIVWVIKGFKKPAGGSPVRPTAESMRGERGPEPTEFADSKEVAPMRKTIIVCPSCSGRLRVMAGKYIDVTCPHCQTIFRTHT